MTILSPVIVLALLLATPHDCNGVTLPPDRYNVLPKLANLPPVILDDDVDATCRAFGVEPGSRFFGWAFRGCTTRAGMVFVEPISDRNTAAEFQCRLYHEVRGHFGGQWPADHPS